MDHKYSKLGFLSNSILWRKRVTIVTYTATCKKNETHAPLPCRTPVHDKVHVDITRLGLAHACTNQLGFQVCWPWKYRGACYLNVLPLYLQSALYSITSRFLEPVATTRTMTLAYNTTNHDIFCHSARVVSCLMLWESTTQVYLAICSCGSKRFLCHRSYACNGLDHTQYMWAGFCAPRLAT